MANASAIQARCPAGGNPYQCLNSADRPACRPRLDTDLTLIAESELPGSYDIGPSISEATGQPVRGVLDFDSKSESLGFSMQPCAHQRDPIPLFPRGKQDRRGAESAAEPKSVNRARPMPSTRYLFDHRARSRRFGLVTPSCESRLGGAGSRGVQKHVSHPTAR